MNRIGCLIVLGLACVSGYAAERYVTLPGGYGTNNPPYTNWADAATNLQDAVNVSTNGDVIRVTNGVHGLAAQLFITSSITLKSVNGWEVTTIRGPYPAVTNRCIYVSNAANTVIDGFTVTNGYAGTLATEEIATRGTGVACFSAAAGRFKIAWCPGTVRRTAAAGSIRGAGAALSFPTARSAGTGASGPGAASTWAGAIR